MQDRHAIAARARLAHRRARDQAAEPALAELGQGRHVINAGDPGAEKERARRRRLAVDAREKVAERRLRTEPDRHRQLGERLAKRPRRAERIAQHAAPVSPASRCLQRARPRASIPPRASRASRRGTPDRPPSRARPRGQIRIDRDARQGRPACVDGPVHHSIGTLRAAQAARRASISASMRSAGQPGAQHAVEERERKIGNRPVAVRLVVQLDARPAGEMLKEGKKIGLDSLRHRGLGEIREDVGHPSERRTGLRAPGLARRGGLLGGAARGLARLALRAAVLVLLAAANRLRRAAQALAEALGLLRRVAGFSRRFGGLLLFLGLLRIELAADQARSARPPRRRRGGVRA